MNPLHIIVSAANLFFGLLFLASLYFRSSPVFAGLSELGGFAANAIAILVAIVVLVLLVFHAVRHSARRFLAEHCLGLFNGLFVVACWVRTYNAARYFHW